MHAGSVGGVAIVADAVRCTEGRAVTWTAPASWSVTSNAYAVAEVGSGLNGKRPKLRRILSDPSASVVVVEHRDRLARFGVEHLEAALSAQGRRIVVADRGETVDDLVRDMIEVLALMCTVCTAASVSRNRAMRALTATKQAELVEVVAGG